MSKIKIKSEYRLHYKLYSESELYYYFINKHFQIMKKITLLLCFIAFTAIGQNTMIDNLLERLEDSKDSPNSIKEFFTDAELNTLQEYFNEKGTHVAQQRVAELCTAYGFETQGAGYGSFDISSPDVFTTISGGSGTVDFESSGAVNYANLSQAFAMDNAGMLFEVEVETGVYTNVASGLPIDATGMAFNPVDNVLYMTTITDLYTIDITNFTATLVGPLNTIGAVAIALAIDGEGNAYTYDIADDTFYTVDLTTGNATAVGNIGFDAGFGQGMTWDAVNDQILMAAFNAAGNTSELRSVDVTTGLSTFIGEILPGALTQVSWLTIPASLELNDDPDTATSLTVGEVFEDFTVIADNTEATATMIDDPSCGNFTEADLWYSFVVPASGSVSVESREDDGSITDTGLSIYEGEIGALVEVVCNDDGGEGLFSLAEVEGRTPGEVLYARVWEWNGGSLGTFQMSAYDTPPPANDDPEGAIELTIGSVFTDFPVTATNVSATDTMIDDPSCGNYGGADVWFIVTPPSTGQLSIEVDTAGGITDTGMSVYSGEIGSLVEVACDDDGGNGLFSLLELTDQDPSAPLYVRVWEWGGGGFGPFQVAAYSDCPVNGAAIEVTGTGATEISICTGDSLPDPIEVTIVGDGVGTNNGWVITDDATGEILGLPMAPPFDLEGVDPGVCAIWYIRYEDGLTGLEAGSNVADLEGCFDLSNPILVDRVSEGGVCEMCEYTLEMNDSFGDGWNGAIMDVLVDGEVVLDDVTLGDDPNNDGFQGILTFPVNTGADVTTVFGDGGGFPAEVSYRIIDLNGIEVGAGTVDTNIEPGTIAADCPTCIAPSNIAVANIVESVSVDISWDGVDNAVGYNWEIQDVGVPQGDPGAIASGNTTATAETAMGAFLPNQSYTLYVQTDCDAGDLSVFASTDFMVPPTPPANDDCVDAIALECATTVTGSTTDASDSGGSASPDVFYTYTGSGVEEIITLSLCDGATDYDSRLRVFDDGCVLVSEIAENDDSCGLQSEVMFTSDGTTTYTVMVEGFGAGSVGNYSLAVSCEEVLSVQDNSIEGFTFFPNPAENVLNINAQREVQNITMFNLVGQKVMEVDMNATSSTLDVSGLSKGTYVMQVISNGQTGTFKVIKK